MLSWIARRLTSVQKIHPPIRMLPENLQLISGSVPWIPRTAFAVGVVDDASVDPYSAGAGAARLEIDRLIGDRGIDNAIGDDDLLE